MDYMDKEAKTNPLWGNIREKTLAERIIRRVPSKGVTRLADIGCGDGYLLHSLSRKIKPKEIYAVDTSKVRLDRVKKTSKKIKTAKSDITKLPFDNGFFDVVICSEVLEHLKDYGKAVKELLRVTKKRLIITVPNEQQPVRTLCPHCNKYHYVAGHMNKFDKSSLKRLIEASAQKRRIKNIRIRFEKFHTIYSYNRLTMKFPEFLRILMDRIFVRLSGAISFFKPNYLMAVVKIR